MEYQYTQPGWDDTHQHKSDQAPRYGVSAEDWNDALEEFAHLGLSDCQGLPEDPIESYHDQPTHTTSHGLFASESSRYDQDPTATLSFTPDNQPDYSSDLTSNPTARHHQTHLASGDFLNYRDHTLQPIPSENSPTGRWSSDHDCSHPSSLYSPGRSHYDQQELPNSHINTSDFEHDPSHYYNLDSNCLPSDPYKEDQELLHDAILYQKSDRTHDVPSSYHHSDSRYGAALDLDSHNQLYRDPSKHHLYQDGEDVRNFEACDTRLDGEHSPRNVGSDLLDYFGSSSNYSELPHELGVSPDHGRSRSGRVFPMDSTADSGWPRHHDQEHDGYSYSPHASEFLERPSFNQTSFLGDDADPSVNFRDPLFEGSAATNLDEFPGNSYSPYYQDYSSHEVDHHHRKARRTPQSYSDDSLHYSPSTTSTSRAYGHRHQFSSELGEQTRSTVGRASLEHLDQVHYHELSSEPPRRSEASYAAQRREIERMRAELDYSTLSNMASPLRPERSFALSRESMPSLSGRRSPHSKSSQSSSMTPMSRLGAHPSVKLTPARSRSPISVAPGHRSPSSILNGDSWSSSHVPIIPRTQLISDLTSGRHHITDPLVIHDDSLRHQLHEIDDLTNEIRRSEQAHQRELAQINQVTSKLAQESINDNLRQADAAYQRELSLANQQTALEQESLDRELRRSEIGYRQDRALADQRGLTQSPMIQDARETEIFCNLDQQRQQLDHHRAELSRQQDKVDTQVQLSRIDRQLRAIDHQREIDRNRKLANLSQFGNLPSVHKGNYADRPLASPYFQQSRFLSAMRRWSDRDKSRRDQPIVYDHTDAYYSLMSDHLPKRLPMFQDPYYSCGPQFLNTDIKGRLGSMPSNRLDGGLKMGNPFVDGIDYDYGFGRVGSLGLEYEQFAREQAFMLDDLYLYELLLRLDQGIDEVERQRRWRTRLRWEEWNDNRSRVEAWRRMSHQEKKSLGLSEGSYWASNLFGIPVDSRFGYTSSLSSHQYRPNDLRTHYTLTSSLASRYPMWKRGGLGLGKRLSNWYDSTRRPMRYPNVDPHSRVHRGYPVRGLSTESKLITPNFLTGSHHPRRLSESLGTASTLSQHLPPLAPLLRTPSLQNGVSSVSSSLSTHLTSHPGTSNLASASTAGSTPSNGTSFNKTSASTPSKAATQANTTGHANSVNMPSKIISGTNSVKSSRKLIVTKKTVPLQPGSLPVSSGSRSSHSTSKSQQLSAGTSNRPRTPRGTSGKEVKPIDRSTTPTVVFNPRVTAVPPESESDPPLIPRPSSRSSMKPSTSVLKTKTSNNNNRASYFENNHSNSKKQSLVSTSGLNLDDDKNLDLITKINTERNRSTPAPPEDRDDKSIQYPKNGAGGARSSN